MASTPKIPSDVNESDPANPPIEFPRPPKAPERAEPRAVPSPQKQSTIPSTTPTDARMDPTGCSGCGEGDVPSVPAKNTAKE